MSLGMRIIVICRVTLGTVIVKRQDLVGEYVGHTAPKTQKKIDEAMGGILFIDEAYTLKPSDGRGDDFGQEAIDTILEQMSSKNGQFGVIVAGYPDDMDRFINSNDGLRSRFEQEFILPDYTAEELTEIFVSMSTNKGYYPDEELVEQLPLLFDAMIKSRIPGWANAREAEKLLRKMTTKWSKRENVRIRLNENGDKERVFECIHIPDEYMQYFQLQKEEEQKSKDLTDKKEHIVFDGTYVAGLSLDGTIKLAGKCKSTILDAGRKEVGSWTDIVSICCSNYAFGGYDKKGRLHLTGKFGGKVEQLIEEWSENVHVE